MFCSMHNCFCLPVDEANGTKPSLQDLLEFLTGSRSIPPSGFPPDALPCIYFDEARKGLPVASTCGFTVCFPLNFPTKEAVFKTKMDLAILGSKENFLLL